MGELVVESSSTLVIRVKKGAVVSATLVLMVKEEMFSASLTSPSDEVTSRLQLLYDPADRLLNWIVFSPFVADEVELLQSPK